MVYEDIRGSVGRAPTGSDGGVAYIRQQIGGGQGGGPLKCLVVADNVWEEEVVSKLLETGVWILVSTRDERVVTKSHGEAVGVDELSPADAESVLRGAAELAPGARLPDDAVDLIELCGRVAMDLASVGRWNTVRGRKDRAAWAAAADKIRAEMPKLKGDPEDNSANMIFANRRKAILRAGFEDLAIGSDDERVPRLWLSLGVLPVGRSFDVSQAAVLLYDRTPSAEDEVSARGVVEPLERWSIVAQQTNGYTMHDAHSDFARERLVDRGDIRRPTLQRWTKHLYSLHSLRSMTCWELEEHWLAVKHVGGESWETTHPYAEALAEMVDEDPLLRETSKALVILQQSRGDWEAASTTCRRMLQVRMLQAGDAEGGPEDVAEESSLLRSLADGFQEEGWLEEAEGLLRRCLGIIEAKYGPQDGLLIKPLYRMGIWVREAGRRDEAEKLLRRCLGILEVGQAKFHKKDIWLANVLFELEVCVRDAGRLEEAEGL